MILSRQDSNNNFYSCLIFFVVLFYLFPSTSQVYPQVSHRLLLLIFLILSLVYFFIFMLVSLFQPSINVNVQHRIIPQQQKPWTNIPQQEYIVNHKPSHVVVYQHQQQPLQKNTIIRRTERHRSVSNSLSAHRYLISLIFISETYDNSGNIYQVNHSYRTSWM